MDNYYDSTPTPENTNNHPPSDSQALETILKLNCHNCRDTMFSLLNRELTQLALLLQEPWTYSHNRQPPSHPNWHVLSPTPRADKKEDRPRTCIYINKNIPLYSIAHKPSHKPLLTTATIKLQLDCEPKILTLVSLYNPPVTFSGLDPWNDWLGSMYF
ncbi:hypothetical protein O181_078852 [Austropuccinia psidii MF-1]|uniref:Uncharacterized protein n=1 Tax=Austropuccinia psidii MF-1 TaxID=1389203 RepID=A0A9Q3FIK5_9BASI|nr:hypothetical protein [Austropuccinia psidii MF-1]